MSDYRIERDTLGQVKVPADALYGAQTQRAVENFRISGQRFPRIFIRSLGIIKEAAAEVNAGLGLLPRGMARAIGRASREVAAGRWDAHFPIDIFQTGSGTSTNMNANEVIARRAAEILGKPAGVVHPNDHVNLSQSTNDVIPSAIHISAALLATDVVLPSLKDLLARIERRSQELQSVVKPGRTHLMDALPVTLGQELQGWAGQVAHAIAGIETTLCRLYPLAMGGTAVGTGANAPADFGRRAAARISRLTGSPFRESDNHFSSQAAMDAATAMSGELRTAATVLIKISNDLRLMNSGPRAGFAEIVLPPLQPGSSIMPGKSNPVVCEAVIMACVQVMGNDQAVAIANSRGEFELNVMLPLIARNLLESALLLGNSAALLGRKVVSGFRVNKRRLSESAGSSLMLASALAPLVGYEKAAGIVSAARDRDGDILETAHEMTGMSRRRLRTLLDPVRLAVGAAGRKRRR